MFHADISPLAAGLPPSILAAAAGRAARLAGFSVTDLLEVDAAHEKASIVTTTLEKVQQQYSRKKEASRDRRSAARKVAPAMPSEAVPSVASAAQAISQISIVGAEPEPSPPPPPGPRLRSRLPADFAHSIGDSTTPRTSASPCSPPSQRIS